MTRALLRGENDVLRAQTEEVRFLLHSSYGIFGCITNCQRFREFLLYWIAAFFDPFEKKLIKRGQI